MLVIIIVAVNVSRYNLHIKTKTFLPAKNFYFKIFSKFPNFSQISSFMAILVNSYEIKKRKNNEDFKTSGYLNNYTFSFSKTRF